MTELRADLSVAFGGTRELRAELLRTSMSGGASELREEFPRSISMIDRRFLPRLCRVLLLRKAALQPSRH